jgi:3-oxoacyl-[acyl-carrier-protein] synthase II
MFYIHRTSCISPQAGLAMPVVPVDNLLRAVEPSYEGIPGNVLRRMSKSVKMGVGSALSLLKGVEGPAGPGRVAAADGITVVNGILIGTSNGGMEDSIKFLKQIVEYDEGMLAPGPFVQSTPNAIASQIALLTHNKGYNVTHVHRGLAFESALIDAAMLLAENPDDRYLAGGVDEICAHNYKFEKAAGWFKKESLSGKDLYQSGSPGSIAGEGAAMFLLGGPATGAVAEVKGMINLYSADEADLIAQLSPFLDKHLPGGQKPDLLLTGENGDNRFLKWYEGCEAMMGPETTVARFKHLCGEYPTASAFALWLSCNLPETLPGHMIKTQPVLHQYRHILIYNNFEFNQHSFMLLERFL